MIPRVLSFDAETNGLWGEAFTIAALEVNGAGEEVSRFVGRCPITGEINTWVKDNVLPQLAGVPVTYANYPALLKAFSEYYMANKQEAEIITHMGYIVEVKIIRDMRDLGLIGDWDAPYPLFDVADFLKAANADPTSVDKFALEKGLTVVVDGSTHDPLYDAAVCAAVYLYLTKK